MKYSYILLITAVLFSCSPREDQNLTITSPDGDIKVRFINSDSAIAYSVYYKGKPVITPSALGFEFKKESPLNGNFHVTASTKRSHDESWEQPWGEERMVRNNYNELVLDLMEKGGEKRLLKIEFRVFDDGLGFRYVFPEQSKLGYFEIMNELTEFNFTENHKAWWIPAYQPERYEYLYLETGINNTDTIKALHTPVTLETQEKLYLSIHEADLTNYASMTLMPDGENGLKCDLAPWLDGVKVKAETPHNTPWRTIQIADNPGELITSRLILNLNPPNTLGDVSWVKPGKYIGIWWGMHIGKFTFTEGENHGATTERAKKYIDFAAEQRIPEVLVEGWNKGWVTEWWLDDGSGISFVNTTDDYDLIEVQEYAQSKGVTLQIYHETMANTRNYFSQIDTAMDLTESLGIRSAKIGQVGSRLDQKEWHYGQYGVNYYREVVKKAAEHKISVNFHEPIKATGERRTYPNMLTREGGRGMEYNAWSGDGGNPPSHTCILPFTRLLGGPMDYTPGIFELEIPGRENNQVNSTLAKQLALYVVIYSPLQMAADLIENYKGHPAFQFIMDVPVDWEETKVLNASIGDYVTIVRKDKYSDNWYLGSITNEESRSFTLRLDFLDEDSQYTAIIYKDADDSHYLNNPADYVIEETEVKSGDEFTMNLASGGGLAVEFRKI